VSDVQRHIQDLRDTLEVLNLPDLDDVETIQKILPMASTWDLETSRERLDPLATKVLKWQVEKARILKQRGEAYWELNRPELLAETSTIPHNTSNAELSVDAGIGKIDTDSLFLDAVSDFWKNTACERERFRQALEVLHTNREQASRNLHLRDYINSVADEFILVQRISWEDDGPIVRTTYCPFSVGGVLGYVLTLLFDEKLNKYLRKCKLKSCGDFFFGMAPSPEGGRPPSYCSDPHKAAADAMTKPKRDADHYKKRKRKISSRRK